MRWAITITSGTLRERAIALDPYLSEAFYNRGTLKHKELGDPVGALADYDRAIEIDPHLASAYLARGLLKRDLLGDLVGAKRDRDRAVSIDPRIV